MEVLKTILKMLLDYNKKIFNRICKYNDLSLDYRLNIFELNILQEIFEERFYADYFPFYKKAIIVDIGAHYGYFSMFASKNTSPDSMIYSYEPSNNNFRCLLKNINSNQLKNVKCENLAIGEKDGESELITSSSFNHSIVINKNNSDKTEKILIKRLSSVIKNNSIDKIDFLKMDCEGAEYQIFETLESSILKKINVISMEFHDLKNSKYNADFIISILKENGFMIMKYTYNKTQMGNNHGKIIAKNTNFE